MNLVQFRERYPEFRTVQDAQVQAYLDMAATQVSEAVVGTRYDTLHGLKTAHMIAISPGGVNVRLQQKDGTTTYSVMFKEVALSKVSAPMVV